MLQVAQLGHLQILQLYNARHALHRVLSAILKELTVHHVLPITYIFRRLMNVSKIVQIKCIPKTMNFALVV